MPSPLGAPNMFHTFQGLAPPRRLSEISLEAPKSATNGVAKRITTPHACAECKRRKIRCDGRQPCGQCLGCRSPKPCYYDKHRQRVIPSRKTLDALSQSLEECRSVLKRLFPTRDPQSLIPLSRQELISLLDRTPQGTHSQRSPSQRSPVGSNTSPVSQEFQSPIESQSGGEDQSLAHLEQVPSQDTEWDEERQNRDAVPAEADDVNGLSLSVDRQTSYLGATSIKAAFLVMLKVAPALRTYLAPINKQPNINSYPTPKSAYTGKTFSPIPWSTEGQTLIDAYFKRVQIFVPMLDEPSFRADYLSGRRNDCPWLSLLNMVFAMGSIVANKSDDHSHLNFYNRSREHLTIDTFGSGHLESLQALSLIGGYYLHYINRPNLANAILGASLRMACAMGLHRETPEHNSANTIMTEQRRRTWWSLFCLDTWATTTLGRPSMGRWGPAITIRAPEGPADPNALGPNTYIVPIIENIKFCKIATQIQDVLAQTPLMPADERASLDCQLIEWHANLPWSLRSTEPCSESIYTARCVMKWRYQNLRIVLHRPVLLNLANRSSSNSGSGAHDPPTEEELDSVRKCRAIAKETIEDIAREWTPNQMLGWNGVWFIYQAVMIPLVMIFWEGWNEQQVQECQQLVEVVLEALEGLGDWSLAARRSREVVNKMYEASKKRPMITTTTTTTTTMMNRPVSPSLESGGNVNHDHMDLTDGSSNALRFNDPNHIPSMGGEGMSIHTATSITVPNMQPGGDMTTTHDAMMTMMDQGGVWDLDGMLWSNLPDGLDMPYDGFPVDFGFIEMASGGGGVGWEGGGYGMQ